MEIGGYTGWGIWLIVLVFAFNLACIPAWFLMNHLRRTFEFDLRKARTFLHVLEQERDRKPSWRRDREIDAAVVEVQQRIDEAEGKGPLRGRGAVALALLGTHEIANRWPDVGERVDRAMDRKAVRPEQG